MKQRPPRLSFFKIHHLVQVSLFSHFFSSSFPSSNFSSIVFKSSTHVPEVAMASPFSNAAWTTATKTTNTTTSDFFSNHEQIESCSGIREMQQSPWKKDCCRLSRTMILVKNETNDTCTYWIFIQSQTNLDGLNHINIRTGSDLKQRFEQENWDALTFKSIVIFFLHHGHFVGPLCSKSIILFSPKVKLFSPSIVSLFQQHNQRHQQKQQQQQQHRQNEHDLSFWSRFGQFFRRFDFFSLFSNSTSSSSSVNQVSEQNSPSLPSLNNELCASNNQHHCSDESVSSFLFGLALGKDETHRLDSVIVSSDDFSRKQVVFNSFQCTLSDCNSHCTDFQLVQMKCRFCCSCQ